MNRLAIIALRVLIVMMFLGALFVQAWIIPSLAGDAAQEFAELGYLAIPYTVFAIAAVACLQVVLVALWALLSKVRRGAIFSEEAFRWVDVIIGAGALATLIIFGLEIHLLGIVDAGGPPLGMLLTAIVIAGAAFVMLMLVMRGLLRSATTLQAELEEVV